MEKEIFKIGDRVFDIQYGWGEVIDIKLSHNNPLKVKFEHGGMCNYTSDGYYYNTDLVPSLSFTEYELKGFSQERPINYNDYIGCWGLFWDINGLDGIDEKLLSKLSSLNNDSKFKFISITGVHFRYFEPLTEEQLKALNLTNDK